MLCLSFADEQPNTAPGVVVEAFPDDFRMSEWGSCYLEGGRTWLSNV